MCISCHEKGKEDRKSLGLQDKLIGRVRICLLDWLVYDPCEVMVSFPTLFLSRVFTNSTATLFN